MDFVGKCLKAVLREIQEEASLPCLVIRSSWVVQGKHTLLFTSISNKVDDLWTSGMNKKQLFES